MKRFIAVLAVSVLFVSGVSGCKQAKQGASAPTPASQAQPGAPAGSLGDALSGKVIETMNSGGYTYVLLESTGKHTWVAAPLAKVQVGQQVTCQPGMEMKNFTSKTLNRTFESIIFSTGIR